MFDNTDYIVSTSQNAYSHKFVDSITLADSGLDWDVSRQVLLVPMQNGTVVEVPSHVAIQRTDNSDVIGVVGNGYNPIQNSQIWEAFEEATKGQATVIGSGYTHNGSKVFIQADFGDGDVTINGDQFKNHVTLYSSHDGSSSFELFDSCVRIICRNSLSLARVSGGRQFKLSVRHTKNSDIRFANVMRAFDEMLEVRKAVAENMSRLNTVGLSPHEMASFAVGFVTPSLQATSRSTNLASEAVYRASSTGGIGNRGETAYDLLNGFTELLTHGRDSSRKAEGDIWRSSEFGTASRQKGEVFDALCQEFLGTGSRYFTERGKDLIALGETQIKRPSIVGVNN